MNIMTSNFKVVSKLYALIPINSRSHVRRQEIWRRNGRHRSFLRGVLLFLMPPLLSPRDRMTKTMQIAANRVSLKDIQGNGGGSGYWIMPISFRKWWIASHNWWGRLTSPKSLYNSKNSHLSMRNTHMTCAGIRRSEKIGPARWTANGCSWRTRKSRGTLLRCKSSSLCLTSFERRLRRRRVFRSSFLQARVS